jgi:hypothetical protein
MPLYTLMEILGSRPRMTTETEIAALPAYPGAFAGAGFVRAT